MKLHINLCIHIKNTNSITNKLRITCLVSSLNIVEHLMSINSIAEYLPGMHSIAKYLWRIYWGFFEHCSAFCWELQHFWTLLSSSEFLRLTLGVHGESSLGALWLQSLGSWSCQFFWVSKHYLINKFIWVFTGGLETLILK